MTNLDLVALFKLCFQEAPGWHLSRMDLKKASCVLHVGYATSMRGYGAAEPEFVCMEGMDPFSDGLKLNFDNGGPTGLVLSKFPLSLTYVGTPCDTVIIHGSKVKQEQIKKIEGGGLRQVDYIGPLITLRHAARYKTRIEAERRAREEADELARVDEEARRRENIRRCYAARRESVQPFLDDLVQSVAGATLVKIVPVETCNGVTITFSNGREMTFVGAYDGGYHAEFWINDQFLG